MEYSSKLINNYNPLLGTDVKEKVVKLPMLIVGANNYMRTHLKHSLFVNYDVYLLFQPRSEMVYSPAAFIQGRNKPIISFASVDDTNIQKAFKTLFLAIDEEIKLMELGDVKPINDKLSIWYMHWVYRCPKISLNDVLHLEPYKEVA